MNRLILSLILAIVWIPAPKAQAMWPFGHKAPPAVCPTGCQCATKAKAAATVAAIPKPDQVVRNDLYVHYDPAPVVHQNGFQRAMTALGPVGQILSGVAGVITAGSNAAVNLATHGMVF